MNRAAIAGALVTLLAQAHVHGANASDDILQSIKSRGVIRTCSVDYAPWNIKNPASNQWEGVNIDLMNVAAGMLKVKVEQVDATWATVIPSVLTQKCDVAAAGFYVSAPRAELITFFVAADSPARTVQDLDKPGITVVVRSGGFEEGVARSLFKQATVKALTADQAGIITLEIASGRADAGAGGYFGNLWFLKANPNVKVRLLSEDLLSKTSIAYAVPPREYFFRDWLNAMLLNLEENGKTREILAKWTR